ncbi:MAG: NADH:ubiquinone oxidoreductase subunit N, partial [Neisseria sp.]
MNLIDLNLMPAMPEIVLFALLIAVLLADLWISDKNRYLTHLMSLGTVIIVAVTQLAVWEQGSTLAFHG